MGLQRKAQELVRHWAFGLLVDTVVISNVIIVGRDLDMGEDFPQVFDVARHVVVGLYTLEMLVKLYADRQNFLLWHPFNAFELLVVVLAIVDTWILQQKTWLWMASVARSARLFRVYKTAEAFPALHDLWLVLTGLANGGRSLGWLALLVAAVVFTCGSGFVGLMRDELDDGLPQSCQDPGAECLNVNEYFGSVTKSALTLLQLATLDNWASHVVRPLSTLSPFQAAILVCFVLATAYALLSVAVGVLVYSTVSLARSHTAHSEHQHQMETKDIIRSMVTYLKGSLAIQDRATIDHKELLDAMTVKEFAKAFHTLELPVENISELFQHMDVADVGEITVEEFENELVKMKSRSSRFDVAILTATVGGASTFVHELEQRTGGVLDDIQEATAKLRDAFHMLHEEAQAQMEHNLEVKLRAQGKISSAAEQAPSFQKPRYTG